MQETYQPTSLDTVTLSLIDFYKTNLSESILFRNRHCTFENDTCSRYAKRMVESNGAVKGYGLIRKRLKRCKEYKLFAFNPQTIGWEKGFQDIIDNPHEEYIGTLLEHLHTVNENSASIGHILKGAQVVHQYVYNEPSDILAKYIEREHVQDVKAKVRNAQNYKPYFQHQLAKKVIPILGLEALTIIDNIPDELIHIGITLYALNAMRTYTKRINFFEQFERLGAIRNQ